MEEILPPQISIQDEDSHYSTINEIQHEPPFHPQSKINHQEASLNSDNILNFDELLAEIGFGKFQLILYLVSIILGLTEGAQVTIFTLMIPILSKQWNLSQEVVSLQISFVFVGFLVGSMLSGPFTDRLGRKLSYLTSSGLTVFVCFATMLCQSIEELLVMRGLLGVFVGCFAPSCVSFLQEITPKQLRGKLTSTVTFSVAVGQIYGFLLASIIVENLTDGDWRMLIFWGTLPGALGFLLALYYMVESPRYLLIQGRYEAAFQIMRTMILQNDSDWSLLNEEKRHKMIIWSLYMNRASKKVEVVTYKSLLENGRWKITANLWGIWVGLCMAYYGNMMQMPVILTALGGQQDAFFTLIYACMSDVLGAIFASAIIDLKGLGRKNSLIIGFLICTILSFAISAGFENCFTWLAICQKMFLSMNFIFCYQLTSDLYPTRVRATGLGMGIAMGRFGGIAMPWVTLIGTKYFGILGPFGLYGVALLIGGFLTFQIPHDTTGLNLD